MRRQRTVGVCKQCARGFRKVPSGGYRRTPIATAGTPAALKAVFPELQCSDGFLCHRCMGLAKAAFLTVAQQLARVEIASVLRQKAMNLTSFKEDVHSTYEKIKQHLHRTRLMHSPQLSAMADSAQVYLKLENEQTTGSFKVRGALSKMRGLVDDKVSMERGIVTASSGNHGLACGYAGQQYGIKVRSFSAETISSTKHEMLIQAGVEVIKHGRDCVEAEMKARQTASEEGLVYVSPYNDLAVMTGQATIGLEIVEDLPDVDAVLMSVGGGGLAGGIAAYVKACNPNAKVYGCQPSRSKVMYESVKAGKIVFEESGDTLSDGTAGGIEEGSITFAPCRDYIDEWLMVDEGQIGQAMYFILDQHHKVIEGAAGVSVAAYMFNPSKFRGKRVAIVLCGSAVSTPTLRTIIDTYA